MTRNPTLSPLEFLIGKWNVTMNHSALPKPLSWQDSFEWLKDAFIIWHWEGKDEVPKATSVINGNESRYSISYYDSRGVSRIYEMSFKNGIWKFWREDSDFFQRFEGKVSEDGNMITAQGENSYDKGKTWEHDYDIVYTRIEI